MGYRLRLAKLDIREKKYNEAIGILEDVLKLDGRNREARLTLALALMETKNPERAIEELNALLAIAPTTRRRTISSGGLRGKKMMAEALREYERIPATSPLYGSARSAQGTS